MSFTEKLKEIRDTLSKYGVYNLYDGYSEETIDQLKGLRQDIKYLLKQDKKVKELKPFFENLEEIKKECEP